MRIGYVTGSTDGYSGYHIHGLQLCIALKSLGHDVDYITNTRPKFIDDYAPKYSLPNIVIENVYDDSTMFKDDYDVLIAAPIHGTSISITNAERIGAKLYHHICEEIGYIQSLPENQRPFILVHPIYEVIKERIICGDSAIVLHEMFGESLRSWCGKCDAAYLVVPPFSKAPPNQPIGPPDRASFVCISRDAPHKRLDHLIEILKRVKDCTIHLITNRHGNMMTAARLNGVADRLKVHVQIDDLEKYALIKKCGAVISPSVYEGFGITLLESASCGKPFIGYSIRPTTDIAGKNGSYLSPPDSVDDLSLSVEQEITDPDYDAKCNESKELASRFTLDAMKSILSAEFGSVVKEVKVKSFKPSGRALDIIPELCTTGIELEEL